MKCPKTKLDCHYTNCGGKDLHCELKSPTPFTWKPGPGPRKHGGTGVATAEKVAAKKRGKKS